MKVSHNLKSLWLSLVAAAFSLFGAEAGAQHLWWNLEGQREATCLYGEITVLATHPGIYYCGANWHPGEPAGGYCGIQHNQPAERRTIFSIWDTSPRLSPRVVEADPETIFNRFGGEGEGAHTHMLWNWKLAETFRFFVRKQPGSRPDITEARYYIFDRDKKEWRHSATISSPNGKHKSVETIGGGLNSFLENFVGKNREVAKIALYRLWLGTDVDGMKCLTRAAGDGTWGILHDRYFLAEGSSAQLDDCFKQLEKNYGKPDYGRKDHTLAPISSQPLPPGVLPALQKLPRAPAVKDSNAVATGSAGKSVKARELTPVGYRLVWADEFNRHGGAPDGKNWAPEIGFVRNEELQWYQPENACCKDGCLVIEARRERKPNPGYKKEGKNWKERREFAEYTSSCLTTKGLHSWMYGRFEARARIKTQNGLWPAIWFLGVDGEWPSKGEIDLMEYFKGDLLANACWGSGQRWKPKWDSSRKPIASFADPTWDEKFHVWRMDWDSGSIKLYVDDLLLNTIDVNTTINPAGQGPQNPFRQPHGLLLNLAIGGTSGGDPSKTAFPTRFEVDYVRVYQKSGASSP